MQICKSKFYASKKFVSVRFSVGHGSDVVLKTSLETFFDGLDPLKSCGLENICLKIEKF